MMFEAKPFLEKEETDQLARFLNDTKERIQQWFVSKRYQKRKVGSLHKGA